MNAPIPIPKRPALLPTATMAVLILLTGFALVRYSVQQRRAVRRGIAAELAAASAHSIEQRVDRDSTRVELLAADLARRGTIEGFKLAAAKLASQTGEEEELLLVSEGRISASSSNQPNGTADDRTVHDWPAGPAFESASVQRAELLGPVRTSSGEWIAFVRAPLFIPAQAKERPFAGWMAAAIRLDSLAAASGLDKLAASGFDYQLSYLSPNSPQPRVVAGSLEFDLNDPVRQEVRGTEGRWALSVAARSGWVPWPLIAGYGVVVAVLALLGSLLTYDLARRPEKLVAEVEARDQRLRAVHLRLSEEIQQREDLEKQFSHASFHDALTGLPNRSYFMERMGRALQRARLRPGYVLAVIVLNFDRFKTINDSLGPAAGDELLTQAVQRFESCLRPEDLVVARLSGDEFAMLLFDVGSAQAALAAAERLQQTLIEPFTVGGQSVFTTASMGIALSSSGYESAEELVRGAHIALSKAKADGRAQYAVFDPATRERIVTRQQLETDLHQAIERGELFLYFQPIVALETGRIAGMETLIRWRHSLEGMVPPDHFIPLAEETGLIVPITRWVLRQACLQARAWREQFAQEIDFYLSVNLSGQDLRRPDVCEYVAGVLKESGLPEGVLRLEVTESIMIGNINAVSELVSRFRAMGVPLLLDDFGTGYSSLSYLTRFKFDYIKIDRSFVSRLTRLDDKIGIVRAIIHMAHGLGIKTIAEGIENLENLEQLRKLGCDFGQGYYFSKPIAPEAAEKLLRSGTNDSLKQASFEQAASNRS